MKEGVLVMAYGTPRDLDDVEAYYTDIRRGNPPPPDLLEELKDRYRAIGGRSPLREITEAQAQGIGERVGLPAYVGQKHAAPFIPDALRAAAEDGVERLIGFVLAPHYSRMSIGDYTRRAQRAAEEIGWDGELHVIPNWHDEPAFIRWLASRVGEAVADLPEGSRTEAKIVFTAHSLPEKILSAGDPYTEQLQETADAVALEGGFTSYRVGWQSAGRTADPWIGPDILDVLDEEAEAGTRAMVVCPCGFVADHLEVLYDVDIEAKDKAEGLGIELRRTRSPNDDPGFLDAVAEVVGRETRSG